MAYIDVRIELEGDDFDEEVFYKPVSAKVVKTDIPLETLPAIAEAAGQSDRWQVGVSNAVLSCLDGLDPVKVSDVY